MLEVKNLTVKYFYGAYGVYDISFSCLNGEMISILGESDAGKTTIAKAISGLIEDGLTGSVVLNGSDLTKTKIKFRDIQLLFQEGGFYNNKSVKYNLIKLFSIRKNHNSITEDKVVEALRLLGLLHVIDSPIKKLNNVDKTLLKLARLMLRQPKLIIIDDIFSKLSSEEKRCIYATIYDLKDLFIFQCPLLFLTSSPNEALYVGSKIMVIRQGFIEQFSEKKEVINNPATLYVDKLMNKNRNFIPLSKIQALINNINLSNLPVNNSFEDLICSYVIEETSDINNAIKVNPKDILFLDGYYLIITDIGRFLTHKLKDYYNVRIHEDIRFYDSSTEKRIDRLTHN